MQENTQVVGSVFCSKADLSISVMPFDITLSNHKLELIRTKTLTLQINVGLLCNQSCRHCHLEAGPHRAEVMARPTMNEVVKYARRGNFQAIDITGGAPELNPNLPYLIEKIAPFSPRTMLRCNLTVLAEQENRPLVDLCKRRGVVIIASLPATNPAQTESQRGAGVWGKSMCTLKRLNAEGYGMGISDLELNIVSNPTGAFLPPSQASMEKKFKSDLARKWGIAFDRLFTFANAPLGRFRTWLDESGNFDSYMKRLSDSFNPCTLDGLMCRTMVSVSWEGFLFDCDFNQAKGLHLSGRRTHVSEAEGPPEPRTPIATGDHCYACTAGSGFTCGGAIQM